MSRMFQLDKGMTQAISHFSRHSDAEAKGPRGTHYTGSNYKNAGQKVGGFYNLSMIVLALAAVVLFGVTNASSTTIEKEREEVEDQRADPTATRGAAKNDQAQEQTAE